MTLREQMRFTKRIYKIAAAILIAITLYFAYLGFWEVTDRGSDLVTEQAGKYTNSASDF